MDEITIIAFDVEARGFSPKKHGIVAVGVVIGNTRGIVKEKRRWHVKPMQGQEFEPRCKEQFWDKHADLLTQLSVNQIDADAFAREFREMLDRYPGCQAYLLSDNPAFDAKFIDHYLDAHGHRGMQYDTNNDSAYRPVHDSDSYARGRLRYGFKNQWMDDSRIPGVVLPEIVAHLPDDDAEKIYKVHCQVVVLQDRN